MLTRYVAEYVTKQAQASAVIDGQLEPDLIVYSKIIGDILGAVVRRATELNYSAPECYRVRRETLHERYGWETTTRYHGYALTIID